jgi:MFS family permease
MGLTMAASAFFEPARTATIPNITSPRELLPANALASVTWSAMLAVGASIGGVVTAVFGQQIAFAVNALSFFVSAIFIARTRYDARPAISDRRPGPLTLTGIPDLSTVCVRADQRNHVAALMMVHRMGLADTSCRLDDLRSSASSRRREHGVRDWRAGGARGWAQPSACPSRHSRAAPLTCGAP